MPASPRSGTIRLCANGTFGWVDARDVAQACRLALEANIQGAEHFTIAAADTLMREPSAALMAKAFPGVPVTPGTAELETLLSIDKAKRMLGWAPRSNQDSVVATAESLVRLGLLNSSSNHAR